MNHPITLLEFVVDTIAVLVAIVALAAVVVLLAVVIFAGNDTPQLNHDSVRAVEQFARFAR